MELHSGFDYVYFGMCSKESIPVDYREGLGIRGR
jgi:hypothetical protein